MTRSRRRFTNNFCIYFLLVLITKVQSEDVNHVRKRMVAMCPPQFQKIRTECYHISSHPLTWLEAHFECKNRNGKLAEPTRIQDAAIRKFLLNKDTIGRDEIYFGGMFDHFAQNWSWGVSGQIINYSSFIGLKNYKKRKSLNYTCTVYTPSRKFRWTPRDCTENHRFLCEHKMPKVNENHREKVYQRWNITYPNQMANEVVMEVREDDRHNNSRRVKVVSASGEEFYLKKTPRRDVKQPLLRRPTYSTLTPQVNRPDNYLFSDNSISSMSPSLGNNEILKPLRKPKKDRTRSKFDREMAKQRRLERSRQRAAKREERQRRLREKEELRRKKYQEQERNNAVKILELQRRKEEAERKLLEEEKQKKEEVRKRLEQTARDEENERLKLDEIKRRQEEERNRLEDERRIQHEEDGKRNKRLEMDLARIEFSPEVITEDYKTLETNRLEKQKEIDKLNAEIAEKYKRDQEEELERLKIIQEKHFKELEERELKRRAEEQRIRDEKEKERQEQIRRSEEIKKQIELERELEEKRVRDENEFQKRLQIEKLEKEEQEKKEIQRKEKEQRMWEEIENKRKAEIQKKIDSEKDEFIEKEIKKKEKFEKQQELLKRLLKLSPEQRQKFLASKRAKKLPNNANEVTSDDKK